LTRGKRRANVHEFASLVASGVPFRDAARRAGAESADALLAGADVVDALIAALYKRLSTDLAPRALQVLGDLLESKDERVRLAAAKTVIDKALPNVRVEAATSERDLTAMSASELASLVDKLEGELAGRATDVTPQKSKPPDAKTLTMLE